MDGRGPTFTPKTRTEKHDKNSVLGSFLTGSTGEYYFRTIKPVPHRTDTHIHFKIRKGKDELLTTQCYIKGGSRK